MTHALPLRLLLPLLPFVLPACGPDVSVSKVAVDADGDGYTEDADCNDAQAEVNPSAEESCDGVDNDCDGVVDQDPTDPSTFYLDADGDGYGDPAAAVQACEAGDGEVPDGTDCDDDDPAVHPDAAELDCTDPTDYNCDGTVGWADADADGVPACEDCDDGDAARSPLATEVCDDGDVDEDCDGASDDADPGVSGAETWYRDLDGDGYATGTGAFLVQCEAPVGYVAATGDCDDYDSLANPGAAEVCDPTETDEDCDGAADDADPSTDPSTWASWNRDADGDGYGDPARTVAQCEAPAGYVDNADDCDDATSTVSPAATERCDALDVDEDCDGLADDDDGSVTGATAWYRDADADGHAGASTTAACSAPAGYLATSTDCDDTDAGVSPDADEVCDPADIDEDCDGLVDDDDPSATGITTFYRDGDGDAYGDAGAPADACDAPAGHVGNAADCDDGDARVSPAGVERCDDVDTDGGIDGGIDEDCDGLADDDDPSVTGATTWYADEDGDGHGGARTTDACELPAGHVADAGDCDDAAAATYPGAPETCGDGVDQDCSGADDVCPSLGVYGSLLDSDADVVIYGVATRAGLGASLATGDFDGDGVGDVVASSLNDTTLSAGSGVVYGYTTLPTSGSHDAASLDAFAYYNTSSSYTGSFGNVVGNLGDLDEDGRDDLFVQAAAGAAAFVFHAEHTGAAPHTTADLTASCRLGREGGDLVGGAPTWLCGYIYATSNAGALYVYAGTDASPSATFTGETTGDFAGLGAAGEGDVDGDGQADLWIGAPYRDESSTNTGTVYLVYGPVTGTASLASADLDFRGGATNDYLGTNIVVPGDVDGDGHDDVAIGKLGGDLGGTESGTVHILTTPGSGVVTTLGGVTVFGDDADDYVGQYDPAFGDADGDGVVDLLLGSVRNGDGGAYAGAAWVVYGPLTGTIDLSSADAEILGTSTYGYLSTGAAFLPDVNGDGADEVAVAAYGADVGSLADRGAVWVFFGG